jgi:enoyl-CoA hydratase/carnithine racemase
MDADELNDRSTVSVELSGDVAVVSLHNPPVNGMSLGLRQALVQALSDAQDDPSVRAVVVTGAGGVFCGGADLRQLGTAAYWTFPRTIELAAVIDGMSKPVVAAIARLALGGGLELALGCHGRVAAIGARLALPEIKLSLIPGGGASLRLPGLIGLERALGMMLDGDSLTAEQALDWGLIDALAEPTALLDVAVAQARALATSGHPLRRARDLAVDVSRASALFHEARRKAANSLGRGGAILAIVDCLESALFVSHEEGFKRAGDWTASRIRSPESKAFRHLFFAEREALRWVDADRGVERVDAAALTSLPVATTRQSSSPVDAIAQAVTRAGCVVRESCESAGEPLIIVAAPDEPLDPARLVEDRPVVIVRPPQGRIVEVMSIKPVGAAHAAWVGRALRKAGYLPVAVQPVGPSIVSALTQAFVEFVRAYQPSPSARGLRRVLRRTWGLGEGAWADWPGFTEAGEPDAEESAMVDAAALESVLRTAGSKLLDGGRVERASDIDLIAVHGCGFPAFRGGPLYQV